MEICKEEGVSNETPLSDSLVGVIKRTPEEILEREVRVTWVDKVIKEVDGSMALLGMPLTDEDKERMKYCLEYPENFQNILEGLIRKHTCPRLTIEKLFKGYESEYIPTGLDWGEPVGEERRVEEDNGLPIKRTHILKTKFCLSDSDVSILKGYVLGAFKQIETYNKELSLSEAQKAELLHALELSAEDMTTQEAYEYQKKVQ